MLFASAALDRLLDHAHVIEMDGDTFRNPPPGKRKAAGAKAAKADHRISLAARSACR
jgi:hypothetical protein